MNSLRNTTGTAVKRQTFTKAERLCSTKLISAIFNNGNVFHTPFFRVLWIIATSISPSRAQAAISVPKRNFRSAVTRNLIKRRFREAYRKEKTILYDCLDEADTRIAFIVIFSRQDVPGHKEMERAVSEVVAILCNRVRKGINKQ